MCVCVCVCVCVCEREREREGDLTESHIALPTPYHSNFWFFPFLSLSSFLFATASYLLSLFYFHPFLARAQHQHTSTTSPYLCPATSTRSFSCFFAEIPHGGVRKNDIFRPNIIIEQFGQLLCLCIFRYPTSIRDKDERNIAVFQLFHRVRNAGDHPITSKEHTINIRYNRAPLSEKRGGSGKGTKSTSRKCRKEGGRSCAHHRSHHTH
mmetsp:Transcript_35453/g.92322  ORF Transcript_35453/g.92322 Transcript_35453/m.92322 type:complete len:209 (-) Transcript_35453:652-1278(-)